MCNIAIHTDIHSQGIDDVAGAGQDQTQTEKSNTNSQATSKLNATSVTGVDSGYGSESNSTDNQVESSSLQTRLEALLEYE